MNRSLDFTVTFTSQLTVLSTVALILQCCVCLSVCRLYVSWRPRAKVTIDIKSYMRNAIDTKMNDLDLCSEVVSRSCQPLRYIRHWISRKRLDIQMRGSN